MILRMNIIFDGNAGSTCIEVDKNFRAFKITVSKSSI